MCPSSIAGVPSSQALPGCLITTPPSVCVPDVIGALSVWIQHQKKKGKDSTEGTCPAEEMFQEALMIAGLVCMIFPG